MRTLGDNIRKFGRLVTRHRAVYPEEIQIEITNVCNLTCAMCPHTFGTIPAQHFPLSQFEALVRKNPPPKRLILTGWGEPLLHPDFFTLLRRARENWPTTQVRFTTNGVLLNPEIQSQLAEHPVAQITVSIDLWPGRTVAPAMQRVLHPSSPKIIRNLEQYALNAALRQTTPLVLQSLLVEENYEDVRQLIAFAGEQGIQAVNLVRLQPYPGIPLERPAWDREQAMITDLKRLGKRHGLAVRSLNQQPLAVRLATRFDRLCVKTDDSLYILMDGQVTPCCNLRNYTLGSLEACEYSIAALWSDPQAVQFFCHQHDHCGRCDALFHAYRPQE